MTNTLFVCVCVFYLLPATLMQSHIEMNQTCVRVATRRCDHFTPSHRIWTLVSFQGLLSTRRTNLCCRRVYRKSDQLISGRWVGFLREWILRWLKGLNRWMDRLLEEWWDQRIIALFVFKPVNYIIFFHQIKIKMFAFVTPPRNELPSISRDLHDSSREMEHGGVCGVKWKQRVANIGDNNMYICKQISLL